MVELLSFVREVAHDLDAVTGTTVGSTTIAHFEGKLHGEVDQETIIDSFRIVVSQLDPQLQITLRISKRGLGKAIARGLLRAILQSEKRTRTIYIGRKRFWQKNLGVQAALNYWLFRFVSLLLPKGELVPGDEATAPDAAGRSPHDDELLLQKVAEERALRWGYRMQEPGNIIAVADALRDRPQNEQERTLRALVMLLGTIGDGDHAEFVQFVKSIAPPSTIH